MSRGDNHNHLSQDVSYHSLTTNDMSHTPATSNSSFSYESIFLNAIEAYRKKTGNDLRSHPLLAKLETCDSPDAVLTTLREQITEFNQSGSSDDKFTRWLEPTVNVLYSLSSTIGGGVSLVSFASDSARHTHNKGCHLFLRCTLLQGSFSVESASFSR